jgi:DNA-binding SARP family transcriptional activator
LEARRGDEPLSLGGEKQRLVLMVLASEPNRVVSVGTLLEAVWDGHAGPRAERSLQVYVSTLRKTLSATGQPAAGPITTWGAGYRLEVAPGCCDLEILVALRSRARAESDAGRPDLAAGTYRQALAMWRGPVLADLRGNRFADNLAEPLDDLRIATLEQRIDADLAGGDHAQLVSELRQLVGVHPFREGLWSRLMLALYRSDRQAEALGAYRELRQLLDDELGVEPGPAVRSLEADILKQSEALAWRPPQTPRGTPATVGATQRELAEAIPPAGIETPDGTSSGITHVPWTIGRHPGCDLVLDDDLVSRRHAQVLWSGGGFVIADLGSTNGTRLDGELVTRAPLVDGAEIGIGSTSLRFVTGR